MRTQAEILKGMKADIGFCAICLHRIIEKQTGETFTICEAEELIKDNPQIVIEYLLENI